MKQCQLLNGQILIIRKAEKNDALGILEYINKVSTESDNLTFGEGEDKHSRVFD